MQIQRDNILDAQNLLSFKGILPNLQLKHARSLPHIPAAYIVTGFLVPDDAPDDFIPKCEYLYVGQARNINSRWERHHRIIDFLWYEEVKIHWVETEIRHLISLERSLIRKYQPKLNLKVGQKPRVAA